MCAPIFAKSFGPHDRKIIGFYALILCLIVAMSFKPTLHPLLRVDEIFNSRLSTSVIEDSNVSDGISENSEPIVVDEATNLQWVIDGTENMLLVDNKISQLKAIKTKKVESMCRTLEANVEYCEIEGDIRIESNSSTIFVVTPNEPISSSFTILPYPRKGIWDVRNWTITQVPNNGPKCSQTHILPSILFSLGGFSGNFFHDFSDVIFPLYSTSLPLQKEVHFLATDYNTLWISKYRQILNKLTKHEILDIDSQKSQIHCFSKLIVGLDFHKELIPSPSSRSSIHDFRKLLRQTYSLERKTLRRGDRKKPCLMMISRRKKRVITNERKISQLARKLGYEVHLAEPEETTNFSRFARKVNSCDVLMGIHGAGLTNMIFLPDNGILIQVVPFGALEQFANLDFGDPATGMNIRYLEYKISMNESSLSQQYPVDHPVLKDPVSFTWKGWNILGSIYLDNQNVTIDLRRFKGVLAKTLMLLSS